MTLGARGLNVTLGASSPMIPMEAWAAMQVDKTRIAAFVDSHTSHLARDGGLAQVAHVAQAIQSTPVL